MKLKQRRLPVDYDDMNTVLVFRSPLNCGVRQWLLTSYSLFFSCFVFAYRITVRSYIVRNEISLISVFVFQSVLSTVLVLCCISSILAVCLCLCLCVKYFWLNGCNFNPIIVEILYTKRARMLECRLYMNITWTLQRRVNTAMINSLNAELNPIRHLLALLGVHHILHISGLRVNANWML
jgi:hypothetical protein